MFGLINRIDFGRAVEDTNLFHIRKEINHYANEILEHQEDHQRMIECINRIEVLSNTIVEEL